MASRTDLKIESLPWSPYASRVFDLYDEGVRADGGRGANPLLMLGSRQSPYSLLALAWDEVSAASVLDAPLPAPQVEQDLPWLLGTVGLISYDAYSPFSPEAPAPERYFRIKKSLIVDRARQGLWLCEEEGADRAQWQIPLPWQLAPLAERLGPAPQWIPSWSDDAYLEAVAKVLGDIRDGRYYQLNLLRTWSAREAIERARWKLHLDRWAGPYGAILDFDSIGLVSFSPERFFSIVPKNKQSRSISTSPIKGTRAVHDDPAVDLAMRRELVSSAKDRAELNMIVDLMRNDLFRICLKGSVLVKDPGSLRSFSNVHHLVATIEGELKPELTLRELLKALCPGGSITGAPKREVMAAIAELELQNRGYLMGNLLYFDAYTGRCDSSILIRTAQKKSSGEWQFAAGSGLVIHSDPREEMAEVMAKARVILELLGKD